MEIKNLQYFIITVVLIGMVLGVGILVLDNVGIAGKNTASITNESVVFTSGSGSTTNDDIVAITYVGNSSVSCTAFNTAAWCANYTTAGAIVLNGSTFAGTLINGTYDVTYTYSADSNTTVATTATVTSLSAISSTWLPLIITIVILSIIMLVVMRSFARTR